MKPDRGAPLGLPRIARSWWPLAASWLLMGAELPALSAVIARLPNPEVNLAAFGSVVFALALIIEAPVMMLLAASTALSRDWGSYLRLRRFMLSAGALLTAIHLLIAFTPVYYFVVVTLIGAPAEIVEPARAGLMIMTPWAWAIAYRRFNQGILIRFGHSRAVSLGTLIRLGAGVVVLIAGYLVGTLSGVAVAAAALATAVSVEAIYAGLRVRPILRDQLRLAPALDRVLSLRALLAFYIPLAMTSVLFLLAQPIGSAALSRMPRALESLAVWPVVGQLIFLLRGMGIAYNEVVVALLDEPGSSKSLRRFAALLATLTTALLLLIAATPLANLFFERMVALPPALATLARSGLWIVAPLPALSVLQSWFQGAILHDRHTRSITEAVVIYLVVSSAIFLIGAGWGQIPGIYIGLIALSAGTLAQTIWLWQRSQPALRAIRSRDAAHVSLHGAEVIV